MTEKREGSLEAPTRHPIAWQEPEYYNVDALYTELERVYDVCHGCRRCVSLCNAFPTLFDLIDESDSMEVSGVTQPDYWRVVEQCYLCDLCYLTKCPYVPPHEWNIDFPHLMLQAKAVKHKQGKSKLRDKMLTSTDTIGKLVGFPAVAQTVNKVNKNRLVRRVMDKTIGLHPEAKLPTFHSNDLRKRVTKREETELIVEPTEATRGKVALFVTCYGNKHDPQLGEDLITVFEHNGIPVKLTQQEKCCGMPKLELGDLAAVERLKQFNIPMLAELVEQGWDLIAPIPSCVLMFKQEIPLMFPDDDKVKKVQKNIFDPFEYLMLRHKAGKLVTNFKHTLGKVAYHVPCHQRVQRIGMRTKDLMQLVPDTTVDVIARCSGHNGTYAVKSECHDISMKICQPVTNKIAQGAFDHYVSDCPMAGQQIENSLADDGMKAESAFGLLKFAYGI